MDLSSIGIFHAVAADGSVTQAAKRLGRAPSNVTTRIQQLEQDLGAELFDRDRKPLVLTDAGRRFHGYAIRMLSLAEEARQVLNPVEPGGLLRVGSMEYAAASRLPGPLCRFHDRWPDVRLEVTTGPTRAMLADLEAQRIDCAIVATDQEEAPHLAGFETFALFEEELLLVSSPRRPGQGVQSLAAFATGCVYRRIGEDWLLANGGSLTGPQVQQVGSYHAMLACVAAGSSVSVMPRSILDLMPVPEGVHYRPLMRVDTVLAWRKGAETPALKAFREVLSPVSNPTRGEP